MCGTSLVVLTSILVTSASRVVLLVVETYIVCKIACCGELELGTTQVVCELVTCGDLQIEEFSGCGEFKFFSGCTNYLTLHRTPLGSFKYE